MKSFSITKNLNLSIFTFLTAAVLITGCAQKNYEEPSDIEIATDVNHGTDVGSETLDYSNPVLDPDFMKLSNGKDLSTVYVSGRKLALTRGSGNAFTASIKQNYLSLKAATKSNPSHKVQWALMDLSNHKVLDQSLSSNKKLFGASSSKLYVASALLDKQDGKFTNSQLQLLADMQVVSSNSAWTNLQAQIGDGSSDRGRMLIHQFTQRMGYKNTRGFQGTWGNLHGNELIPSEAVELLYDLYRGAFPGASTVWKIMHTCRTGASRGLKYIPSNIFVGGKTGTYDGPTVNPETGGTYNVTVRNHLLVFYVGGRQLGLAILANSGTDESAALLAGGLIREYGQL